MHSNDHPMHGQPRLDFDVLHSVCNCLTKVSDVLSFALTCSTLRKSALQRYLMMSPVVLSDANSVDRFYSFIFADAAARAPFIYGLELARFCSDAKDGSRFQVSSDRLVAILEVAIHLEYLHLSTTIGDPVFTAAAKVTSIRELIVHADDSLSSREAVHKFLTTLRSPLQRLRIEDYGDTGVSASFLHQYLAHFASTLEILELDNFYLDLFPSALTTPFAATRSLKIESVCYFGPLSIPVEVLLRLFPNLDHTLELHLDALDTRVLDENSPALRERSKEVQKSVTWSGFDHVICDAKTAFSMALQCPIRRMDIKCINTWVPPVKRDLMETLRHNSPRHSAATR
ncbi:hypothetical protein LXA43DRAFT_357610 [Ganoderma leucocontextum]|nr:hypothetical protein LXA43DRAFT_357610 [Ganoderma leucocontextum]